MSIIIKEKIANFSYKLNDLLKEYKSYQKKYGVEEQRIVHMTNYEILSLNQDLQ